MSQRRIISCGFGVNSTANIALYLLGKRSGNPEIVFADTGAELPETYEYMSAVRDRLWLLGYQVTTLDPHSGKRYYYKRAKGLWLYDLLWKMETVPSFRWRFCNSEYKRVPIRRYANGAIQEIGICADEAHRARDESKIYPVLQYSRQECIDLVESAGLPTPHKTGCWFCPLQSKAQWIDLHDKHPDLWDRAVRLEDRSTHWKYLTNGRSIAEQMKRWKDAKS